MYLGVGRLVVHVGESAIAVFGNEIANARQYLPVFGIAAAYPTQPLVKEQLAVR
ncbi:hypothetical protein D3C87_1604720 [compost metagenome]